MTGDRELTRAAIEAFGRDDALEDPGFLPADIRAGTGYVSCRSCGPPAPAG